MSLYEVKVIITVEAPDSLAAETLAMDHVDSEADAFVDGVEKTDEEGT